MMNKRIHFKSIQDPEDEKLEVALELVNNGEREEVERVFLNYTINTGVTVSFI